MFLKMITIVMMIVIMPCGEYFKSSLLIILTHLLRILGPPKEALLATGQSLKPPPQRRPTSPIATRGRSERIPDYYLRMAREIFHGLSDREIQVLYKKVK